MRAWSERGFKWLKRAGWQWQATKLKDAERAMCWWLALAVATRWLVSVGGEAETESAVATGPDWWAVKRRRRGTRWRTTGVFQRGAVVILGALIHQESFLLGHFSPELWPHETALATWAAPVLAACAGAGP